MKFVQLGSSDLNVSAMCLGCLEFGTTIARDAAFAVLDAYFEAGGRFLDTSNNYAFWAEGGKGGESESLLGEWIGMRGNRDELVIATKVGAQPTVPGSGFEAAEGLGAKAIAAAADLSLHRLGVDQIDLYYVHIEDLKVPTEQTLEALETLRKSGKIREIGCSNHSSWRIEEARQLSATRGYSSYQVVQQRHSYLQPKQSADLGPQKVVSTELAGYLAFRGNLTLVAYSTLLTGVYEGAPLPERYDTPDNRKRLLKVEAAAKALGVTPNQVVLAWLMQQANTIPLIATRSVDRLRDYLKAAEITQEALTAQAL
ncbi:aryl-alcohol dehydrogenase-like predicted oxidoreductase [Devosia sp. UYZn731]|uniref:aldo/keto reductase n=1 Tax=Devosia sp. UYZn731 TaxID=3156345 RepID=UPI003391ACD4